MRARKNIFNETEIESAIRSILLNILFLHQIILLSGEFSSNSANMVYSVNYIQRCEPEFSSWIWMEKFDLH